MDEKRTGFEGLDFSRYWQMMAERISYGVMTHQNWQGGSGWEPEKVVRRAGLAAAEILAVRGEDGGGRGGRSGQWQMKEVQAGLEAMEQMVGGGTDEGKGEEKRGGISGGMSGGDGNNDREGYRTLLKVMLRQAWQKARKRGWMADAAGMGDRGMLVSGKKEKDDAGMGGEEVREEKSGVMDLWDAAVEVARKRMEGGKEEDRWREEIVREVDGILARHGKGGSLHEMVEGQSLDGWTYEELVGLQALAYLVVWENQWFGRMKEVVLYHLEWTQPDNVTTQPWGLAAFLMVEETQCLAEQQLHDLMTQAGTVGSGKMDLMSVLLLGNTCGILEEIETGTCKAGKVD